ncbi:YraN family protein [Vampirovibrio sp.]|uniref:YraN family protein n=1 Tax=Vampirovibrio sp. TaxID=2717857 RepID=UPI0035932AF3
MSQAGNQTGHRGEQIAQLFLRQKGFRIEALNWRWGKNGEIDLVVFHPEVKLLAFVEVKTRKSLAQGSPQEAVDQKKIHQILSLAEAYLSTHPVSADVSIRFDVIAIYFPGGAQPANITHIESAFTSNDA